MAELENSLDGLSMEDAVLLSDFMRDLPATDDPLPGTCPGSAATAWPPQPPAQWQPAVEPPAAQQAPPPPGWALPADAGYTAPGYAPMLPAVPTYGPGSGLSCAPPCGGEAVQSWPASNHLGGIGSDTGTAREFSDGSGATAALSLATWWAQSSPTMYAQGGVPQWSSSFSSVNPAAPPAAASLSTWPPAAGAAGAQLAAAHGGASAAGPESSVSLGEATSVLMSALSDRPDIQALVLNSLFDAAALPHMDGPLAACALTPPLPTAPVLASAAPAWAAGANINYQPTPEMQYPTPAWLGPGAAGLADIESWIPPLGSGAAVAPLGSGAAVAPLGSATYAGSAPMPYGPGLSAPVDAYLQPAAAYVARRPLDGQLLPLVPPTQQTSPAGSDGWPTLGPPPARLEDGDACDTAAVPAARKPRAAQATGRAAVHAHAQEDEGGTAVSAAVRSALHSRAIVDVDEEGRPIDIEILRKRLRLNRSQVYRLRQKRATEEISRRVEGFAQQLRSLQPAARDNVRLKQLAELIPYYAELNAQREFMHPYEELDSMSEASGASTAEEDEARIVEESEKVMRAAADDVRAAQTRCMAALPGLLRRLRTAARADVASLAGDDAGSARSGLGTVPPTSRKPVAAVAGAAEQIAAVGAEAAAMVAEFYRVAGRIGQLTHLPRTYRSQAALTLHASPDGIDFLTGWGGPWNQLVDVLVRMEPPLAKPRVEALLTLRATVMTELGHIHDERLPLAGEIGRLMVQQLQTLPATCGMGAAEPAERDRGSGGGTPTICWGGLLDAMELDASLAALEISLADELETFWRHAPAGFSELTPVQTLQYIAAVPGRLPPFISFLHSLAHAHERGLLPEPRVEELPPGPDGAAGDAGGAVARPAGSVAASRSSASPSTSSGGSGGSLAHSAPLVSPAEIAMESAALGSAFVLRPS